MRIVRLLVLLSTIATLLTVKLAQAQSGRDLRVTEVNLQQLPALSVTVQYAHPAGTVPAFQARLNGEPVQLSQISALRSPVAVALVADLSAAMSDQGTALVRRFDNMRPLAQQIVGQLQSADHRASLTVFTETVTLVHPLTNDLSVISDTVNSAPGTGVFQPQGLPANATASPYPLGEAMLAGLQQLTQPTDPAVAAMPRVLLVLATGVAEQQVDVAVLQQLFSQARAAERPISLLIVGFGSDLSGEFSSLPANPGGLAELARALGGQYIAMGSGLPDVRAKQRLTSQLTAMLQQGEQFQLQGTVQRAQAGNGTLTVEVGPLQVSRQVTIPSLPTSFSVAADTANPVQARFSIATQFEQTPIQTVEYALNGTKLEQRGMNGPTFDLRVNTSAAWFQQRYPPGSYQLSATAFDAAGQPITNSTNTVTMTIAPSADAATPGLLSAAWLVALLLLGVVGVGGWFAVQRFRSEK